MPIDNDNGKKKSFLPCVQSHRQVFSILPRADFVDSVDGVGELRLKVEALVNELLSS